MKQITEAQIKKHLVEWIKILRLNDWDIKSLLITQEWRKSGDIKIDRDNKMATVLIHESIPEEHLEEVVVHELLHLRIYGMDQMLEETINILFGNNDKDPKKIFAMNAFFVELESTVENLTKAMMTAHGKDTEFWFKRVNSQIREELTHN